MTDVVEIKVQNEVAILRFNRADALNTLTVELAKAIVANLIELDGRDDVLGIVLTGAGDRAFCACLLYTSPSPRDQRGSRMPSSA